MDLTRHLRRRRGLAGGAAALLCGAALAIPAASPAQAEEAPSVAAESLTIPLNNDTAEEGTDCPTTGGPYWHFVISPNNGESMFVEFHLNLGDATTYDTSMWVENGTQADNVFVEVPAGKELASLVKTGSSADIHWSGVGTEPAKFQLSHLCSHPPGMQDLTVTKTAAATYDLTYAWDIAKDASPASQTVDAGMPATFDYAVGVSHDTGTESAWAVTGAITVANPNGTDITADVTDAIPGAECAVDGGSGVLVPAGGSVDLPYACTLTGSVDGTNTATATWDADAYDTPTGSATGTADFAFGDPTNVIDECVDVTDTIGGTLGTVCVGDDNPTTFTYRGTFPGPTAGTCVDMPNTATETTNDTGTTDSASASVQVCSYQARLTPGYWKNHLTYDPKNPTNPWVAQRLPQTLGTYLVDSTSKATAIWNAMNCSNTGSNSQMNQNAVGCLAGHLLAAKLNVANGANPCIGTTITAADGFLAGIPYSGPSGNYTGIGSTKRATAISLKTALDAYDNGNGCH